MTKFFVKKPFFVVVSVIIILLIGVVSLRNMNTDLMPDMNIPYMMVITTEPGASPQKVESDVTKPLESALGTVSGVEKIVSRSADNYSMVMLEFADGTNMDSALVRVSKVVDNAEIPDECGNPNIMEVSMDMMATMYTGVNYEGKDIKELSDFSKKTLQPYLERQDGVASITSMGLTTDSLEVKLNQDKIDRINDKILSKTNDKLSKAQSKIDSAGSKISKGESTLSKQQKKLDKTQNKTNKQVAGTQVKLSNAQATKAAYEATLNSLKASQSALEAEKKAYTDAKLEENYKKINEALSKINEQYGSLLKLQDIKVPANVKEAVENKEEFEKFIEMVKKAGKGDQVKDITYEKLQQLYNAVEVRLPQINTELANLKTKILVNQSIVDELTKKMKGMDKAQSKAIAGGYSAASGFGAGKAQISSAKSQMSTAKKDLKDAKEKLKNSRKAAIENSNIDALLSIDTLSKLIYAQNFSMPAGYIDDKKDNQWLVDVGDNYKNINQIKSMVLTKVSGIGEIKLSDVADITVVDNSGDSYSKIDGKPAVLLAIYKSSTANTSSVSKNLTKAFGDLEKKYTGLSITSLMDQSQYIDIIVKAVLQSILLGAVLAILVLALFLKDVKPTLIVAFSIPFSVLFAIIIMYFTGITLNVMSLAGLCLGIGMLVDNSIVVMENVYRLRSMGISASRAAVQGTRQVAAPIVSSTITTICVFLPMIYVKGTVREMLIPFAFTMTYALVASLIVSLTVVPTISSAVLKKTKNSTYKWFEKLKDIYAGVLEKCLKHKVIPIAIAVLLLALCVAQVFRMGLVMMDDMESNQISVSLEMKDDTDRKTAYATADKVMKEIMKIDGINKVGAMDGAATATAGMAGSSDNYTQFTFQIITDDDIKSTGQFRKIIKNIENNTKNIKCKKLKVSSSAMGDMSSMMSQGIKVNIYGDDQDKLIKISKDVSKMVKDIKGTEDIDNGLQKNNKQLHLKIDKNKAAKKGLTVAQIYEQLAADIKTDKTAITIAMDSKDLDVNVVDERNKPSLENLMNTTITATTKKADGIEAKKEYKLSEFAKAVEKDAVNTVTRENQSRYMSVSATVKDGYNATLLSRKLQKKIDSYKAPKGYNIEIQGESEQVMEMIRQMVLALLLGLVLVYLVMVAQFQSLLSPFIILFTVPLAFTGGMIGLIIFGQSISAMALMGFMVLMGTVVNNGIVFVDYANKLRIQGVDKRVALIATGKTRMRPILMTALTTILSMSVMVFSTDAGNAMQRGMAIVVSFGLLYATFMTLFIVPVLYDIFYRKQPRLIDVGDDNLDEIPDETSELLEEMQKKD
ncbi:efflux RND transporter permease subunit [uncultured Eubacterium sp.]|uniref:efflux RND transporter permease subunit n=1 Tax=Eubacterium sp. TaxID=142586 RepID=UPI0026727141|nr:efflux RND transporter permease subunit [uncultured Eubacterium sp.]